MKYRKIIDADSGEEYRIPFDDEQKASEDIPAYCKTEFPEIKIDYDSDANIIIKDLTQQLKSEKKSKKLKLPFGKIIATTICVCILLIGTFGGINYITQINYDTPSSNTTQTPETIIDEKSDKNTANEEPKIKNILEEIPDAVKLAFPIIGCVVIMSAIVNLLKYTTYGVNDKPKHKEKEDESK